MTAKFHEGDKVVLALGTYQGATGVFLRLRDDVKWADIREANGDVRSHPMAWLALAKDARSPAPAIPVETGRKA